MPLTCRSDSRCLSGIRVVRRLRHDLFSREGLGRRSATFAMRLQADRKMVAEIDIDVEEWLAPSGRVRGQLPTPRGRPGWSWRTRGRIAVDVSHEWATRAISYDGPVLVKGRSVLLRTSWVRSKAVFATSPPMHRLLGSIVL